MCLFVCLFVSPNSNAAVFGSKLFAAISQKNDFEIFDIEILDIEIFDTEVFDMKIF